MVSKTTQRISEVKAFSIFMLIAFLFFNLNSFSQTITSISPTRVTTGSVITVTGSGFTGLIASDAVFVNSVGGVINLQIRASSFTVVSDTELNFVISRPQAANQLDRYLRLNGVVNYTIPVNYIGPTYKTLAIGEDFHVTEVFTDWDYNNNGVNFYRSNWYSESNTATWPNKRHNLLAFTVDGTTYSTGVDDGILTTNGITFTPQIYEAYATNGISGFPYSGSFLAMADEIDGFPAAAVLNDNVRATAYDVMIDGVNGLDLGTGMTNFNQDANIEFFSGNGNVGAVGDNIPDLVITQLASPNGNDVYYYADVDGNVVGKPIRLTMNEEEDPTPTTSVYKWYLDLYRMDTSVPYDLSLPAGVSFGPNEDREFRMIAFELSDFNINNTTPSSDNYIGKISNINLFANGSADLAFLAYNKDAFVIKSPKINEFPISRNICIVPSAKNITFSVDATIVNPSPSPSIEADREEISYQWFKGFMPVGPALDSYTLPSTITSNDLGEYKVRISNFYGAVDLPVTLAEGGTPTFWDGTSWNIAPALAAAGVPDIIAERNLIFRENYNENVDLEGCDCRVPSGKAVTIPSGRILKLYSAITVEPTLNVLNENGNIIGTIPAGEITFEDDASLVQTKPVTTNENSGSIIMERKATFLNRYDYMYWSSPVIGFDIANIPGEFPYQWSVNALNVEGTKGDWIPASGVMKAGKGYIKRFPSDDDLDFTTEFRGTPNNGTINVDVFESDAPFPADLLDRNWNLVGNPYPSALEAETFLVDNTNLEGNVQIWSRNEGIFDSVSADPFYNTDFVYNYGDQYITYNATGSSISNSFNGKIASGQAFFVQVKPFGEGTVTFNNAMRSDSDAPDYDNGDFFRSTISVSNDPTPEKQLIWIGLINEDNSSSMALVGYVDGATNGKDRLYDAHRNGDNMNIYSLVDDTKMTIQGRSYPFDNSDTVALGVDLLEDGIYKIAIDHLEGSVFENESQGVYLEDTYLNIIHDLRATPYSFAGISGSTKDRFILRYTVDQQLSVADQNSLETFIYIKEDRLYVKASNNIKSIVVYDVTGKQVATYKLGTNVSRTFNTAFQYPRGAYIAVINLDNDVTVGKKLIN